MPVSFPQRRPTTRPTPEDILRLLRARNPHKYHMVERYLMYLWADEVEAERRASLPPAATPRDEVS
jgi:hypothetical protein